MVVLRSSSDTRSLVPAPEQIHQPAALNDSTPPTAKPFSPTDICVAIAGRTINFQAKLRRHETKPLRDSVSILEGRDFHIPHKIKPEDLDWEQSRPLKPWPVKREDHIIHGRWYLEWIELCREEVSKVLCGGDGASGRARQASTATAGQETAAIRAL